MKTKVTILGAGNMGTALAKVIGGNVHSVTMWNYAGDPDPLNQVTAYHENKKYLPGIVLPKNVRAEHDLKIALEGAVLVILAVPSSFIERQLEGAAAFLSKNAVLLDVSKGFTGVLGGPQSTLSKQGRVW